MNEKGRAPSCLLLCKESFSYCSYFALLIYKANLRKHTWEVFTREGTKFFKNLRRRIERKIKYYKQLTKGYI